MCLPTSLSLAPLPPGAQEPPVSVATGQLDSALVAGLEVVPGRESVAASSAWSPLAPSLILLALALFVLRTLLRARGRAETAPAPLVEAPEPMKERWRPKAEREPKRIPLPPHISATLDRLANERAEAASGQAQDGSDRPLEVEAIQLPGCVPEHVAVSLWSVKAYDSISSLCPGTSTTNSTAARPAATAPKAKGAEGPNPCHDPHPCQSRPARIDAGRLMRPSTA